MIIAKLSKEHYNLMNDCYKQNKYVSYVMKCRLYLKTIFVHQFIHYKSAFVKVIFKLISILRSSISYIILRRPLKHIIVQRFVFKDKHFWH